jgi:hypothetical protein
MQNKHQAKVRFQTIGAQLLVATTLAASSGCSLVKMTPLGFLASSASSSSGSSGSSSGAARKPANAVDAKGLPVYCASEDIQKFSNYDGREVERWEADVSRTLEAVPKRDIAAVFAGGLCVKEGPIVAYKPKIEAKRSTWMKANYIDDRDFAHLVGFGNDVKDAKEWSFEPVNGYLVGNARDMLTFDKLAARSRAFAIAGYIEQHFSSGFENPSADDGKPPLLPLILLAQHNLDLAALLKEIDADKHSSDDTRYQMRHHVMRAVTSLAAIKKYVAEQVKTDPGFAKLAAIAEQTAKEWATPNERRTVLLNQLEKIEAGVISGKRSALANCGETTSAELTAELAKVTLPSIDKLSDKPINDYLRATTSTINGFLAYRAVIDCAIPQSSSTFGPDFYILAPGNRGAMSATISAWLANGEKIVFDDRKIELSELLSESQITYWGNLDEESKRGVIGSIKTSSDDPEQVEISFKPVHRQETVCAEARLTNRIQSIDNNGRVTYVSQCVSNKTVTVDDAPSPETFSKIFARGLKPGMFLITAGKIPLVATSGPSSKIPVMVFGAAVK